MARKIWARKVLAVAMLAIAAPHVRAQLPTPATSTESTIVMPLEMVAGKPATLAVLSPAGRVVPEVKLALSSGDIVTTDESGRAHFLAPPDVGIFLARIPGMEARAAADVTARTDATHLEIRAPALASVKDRFNITGSGFQGDADQNHVELGDKPAFVLAASPKELIILASPETAPGNVEMVAEVGTQQVSTGMTLMDVSSDAIGEDVRPGRLGKFALHVRGTTQPVDLDVENMSPGTARFKHGDRQHLRTSGGSDNSATIEIKGMRTGEVSYAVSLKPQPGIASVEVARDFLQVAYKLAKADEKSRINKVLMRLGPRRTDIAGARKEFAKIVTANSAGDFQALIRAAGEALSGQQANAGN